MQKRTMVAAPLAALALMAGATPAAAAETGGSPEEFETSRRGAGTASADAEANGSTGALSATSSATGGAGLRLPLFPGLLPGTGPASAGATAGVNRTVAVQAGVYEVTVRYVGADADEAAHGGASDASTMSLATFTSADEANKTPEPHIDFGELPDSPGDISTTLIVEVPEAGSLFVAGRVTAASSADGRGNSAQTTATVESTSFDVQRVD